MVSIRAVLTALAVTATAVTIAPAAYADPVPAPYAGTTHGDILDVEAEVLSSVLGVDTLSAVVGHAATAVDSEADPRAYAESANLDTAVAPVGVDTALVVAEANADTTTPDDSYAESLGEVDAPPLLDTGLIIGSGEAHWAGDAACVEPGTPIAQSTTELASATVGDLTLPLSDIPVLGLADVDLVLAALGALTTSGSVMLSPNGATNDVVSASSASISSIDLLSLDGAPTATVDVVSPTTLTATSDGTTGTVDYTAPDVTLNIAGLDPIVVSTAGSGGTVTETITLLPDLLEADVTVSVVANATDDSAGALADGSVPAVLEIGLDVRALGALAAITGEALATTDLGLLPLAATAEAPAGGVECEVTPPEITAPADGSVTADTTPTISGTGHPGATMEVFVDGESIGTVTVAPDGTWSIESPELAPGEHTVEATQTYDDIVLEAMPVTFTVVEAPVITAPADGSTTTDTTPPIEGTGTPGATIEVFVDGESIGTVTVAADGTWSIESPELAPGEHTVDATQTLGDSVLEAEPVGFIVLGPPVVTSPADGSSTSDTTPAIEGTGEPGATVTVFVDGQPVGTVVVGDDGTWTLVPEDALSCGEHTITATQELGGAVSAASDPVTVTITCPDAAPTPDALPDTGTTDGLGLALVGGLLMLLTGGWLLRREKALV